MPGTRKLGRPTDHRTAMLRGMVTYLLDNGQIETTYTRAKEVSALADKMITLAKDNTLASYRQALSFITVENVARKLFHEIGPSFDAVNGGYTAVYKLGPRRGDGAEMALIRLTAEAKVEAAPADDKKPAKKTKPAAKPTVEEPVKEEKPAKPAKAEKPAKAKAAKAK